MQTGHVTLGRGRAVDKQKGFDRARAPLFDPSINNATRIQAVYYKCAALGAWQVRGRTINCNQGHLQTVHPFNHLPETESQYP